MLVLFIGAGVAYTWYMGKNVDPKDVAVPKNNNTSTTTVIKHAQPGANAQEGVEVQSLVSPVIPGSNTSITVRALPYSTCTISFIYNNITSKDSGLVNKTADDFGMVSWSWTVGESVPIGNWPAKVICTWKGRTAVVSGHLEVVSHLE
jgi:hypothetical protein